MSKPIANRHIVSRFDDELSDLQDKVMAMADLVGEQLQRIRHAARNRDGKAAQAVIDHDRSVDLLELKTDKSIIQLIARRAPVGSDLRFVVAVSRIVNDLERIGDEARDLARLMVVEQMAPPSRDDVPAVDEIESLLSLIENLLRSALLGFHAVDEASARQVCNVRTDNKNELHLRLSRLSDRSVRENDDVTETVNLVLTARALERMTGHVANIGEHVIYLATGEDLRHQDKGWDGDNAQGTFD